MFMKSGSAPWRAGWAWPAAVLLAGLGVSTAGAWWLHNGEQAAAQAEFRRSVLRVSADIADRFRKPLHGLNGALGVYATHAAVQRSTFQAYLATRNLAVDFPGVRGFGFIERVPREALASFEAAERDDGAPQFTVRQLAPSDAAELFVIKFIEPAARNPGALGLDVGSEAVRREAVLQSQLTGEPTLTGTVTLVQDQRQGPGVLLVVPVFRPAAGAATADGRHGELRGLLYAPIVIAELLEGLGDVAAGQVRVEIFDTASGTLAGPLMYDSRSEAGALPAAAAETLALGAGAREPPARFETLHLLTLPGRLVTLRVSSTPAFEAAFASHAPWSFFLGTLLASGLLAALLRQQATGRRRAETLAQQMTADLGRLALVARRTSNAVVITDARRRITWVNEGFERITGYAAAEVLGRSPGALLQADGTDPGTVQRLRAALDAGEGFTGEILNRGKTGRTYWLSLEIQPLRADDGALLGFMAIELEITERKAAEQALASERLRLSNVVEGTGAGTWEWDHASGQVFVDERWAQMLGYTLDELGPATIDDLQALLHPDDRPLSEALLQQHFAGQSPFYECEARMRHKQGHWVWTLGRGRVLRHGAGGQPAWIAGTHMDISARRELEAAVQRNNELLTTVLESLPCGLSVFDDQLNLLTANREFRRLLDLPDALLDHTRVAFEDIIRFNAERGEYGPGDVQALVDERVARARQPATTHHFDRVRPNGVALHVRGAPLAGGGFVTTYNDISARRRAEEEARRSGELLRGAIDAIDEAFVLYDAEDRLVLCNDRYRETYAGVAHLIVPGVRFEDLLHASAQRGDIAAAKGREEAWVVERLAAHRRADGTLVQRLDNGKTLRIIERRLPDGHIVGFRLDITELVHATETAQQASLAKSRFLANMSHEIRTPMNAILGMLALLRRTDLTPRQHDYAQKTERAARSLLVLLNDILDFSKVEAGKMLLDPQPFRPEQLLQDVSVILGAQIGDKPLALVFDVDPALPRWLLGDALRLQQVLVNLGGNAVKFTAEGTVVVSLQVLESAAQAVRLRVAVRDTGIGIAPEHHEQIFSGFTQAEPSTTRRFGGTGLGLAISRRLVALMGSDLRLDSRLGQGSCFHFETTFPVAAPACEVPQATVPGRGRLAGLRLLVAEDNANNQQIVRELLEDEGAAVRLAADGQEAVAAVAAAGPPFDVVLMDLQMPVMDGLAATRQIRHGLGRLALPIVAMTANALPADREACLAAGMNEHVGKPFEIEALVALLRRLAGRPAETTASPAGSSPIAASGARGSAAVAALAALADSAHAAGVDLERALARLGGKRAIYERMLRRFVEDLAGMPGQLRAQLAAADAGAAARLLHTLKGLAATLGAGALAAAAEQARLALAEATTPKAAHTAAEPAALAMEAAGPRLQSLLQALQALQASQVLPLENGGLPAVTGEAALDPAAEAAALQELAALLENSDMRATDVMTRMLLRLGPGAAPDWQALDEAVTGLNFERALRLCRALLTEAVA